MTKARMASYSSATDRMMDTSILAELFANDLDRGHAHGLLLGQQAFLIRHLKKRFGSIPCGVVAAVVATSESSVLRHWFNASVSKSALKEIFEEKYLCPWSAEQSSMITAALDKFADLEQTTNPLPEWPPFVVEGIHYNLVPLNDTQLDALWPAVVQVEERDISGIRWYDLNNAVFGSLSLCHMVLHRLAGKTRTHDDEKCSFSYPFLLHFIHEGHPGFYILRVMGLRSAPTLQLFKLASDGELTKPRYVIQPPFSDLGPTHIRALFLKFTEFVYSMYQILKDDLKSQSLIGFIPANLRAYGVQEGRIFDFQFEETEAFQAFVDEFHADGISLDLHSGHTRTELSLLKRESILLKQGRERGMQMGRAIAKEILAATC